MFWPMARSGSGLPGFGILMPPPPGVGVTFPYTFASHLKLILEGVSDNIEIILRRCVEERMEFPLQARGVSEQDPPEGRSP